MIKKIRNKVTEKEAIQFIDGGMFPQISKFAEGKCILQGNKEMDVRLKIETLEGDLYVSQGDWIIKGLNGEFYPCKPDIFEKSYEIID